MLKHSLFLCILHDNCRPLCKLGSLQVMCYVVIVSPSFKCVPGLLLLLQNMIAHIMRCKPPHHPST